MRSSLPVSYTHLDVYKRQGEIRARYEQDGYLCDTHTAVAFHVAGSHKREGVPMVVLSTASPYKFPRSVLEALGHTAPQNDFEAMQELQAATGRKMCIRDRFVPMDTEESLQAKQKHLLESVHSRKIKVNYHDSTTSFLAKNAFSVICNLVYPDSSCN